MSGRKAALLLKVIQGSRSLLTYCPAVSWVLYTARADSQSSVYCHTHRKRRERKMDR